MGSADAEAGEAALLPSHPSETTPEKAENQSGREKTASRNKLMSVLAEPFQWLQLLSSQMSPSFVFGVILVYGLSHGFSGSYFKVVPDFYWKDVRKVQPSTVQLYLGFYYIPWVMKPVWGILTDVFPIRGYKRKPYFVVAGVLGCASALTVASVAGLPATVALGCLVGVAAGMAIADVTIDACIAKNSIEMRALAPDMQSLCGFCSSAGALVGYSTSGFFVHHLGPQGALGLLAFPPACFVVLGFVIYEIKFAHLTSSAGSADRNKKLEDIGVAIRDMQQTIKVPEVWKPTLYIFLSLALNIDTHEGQFYWYTDPKAGPAFSQEFVGITFAIGAVASMVGVVLYHKKLKNWRFRDLLFYAQLVYGLSGMLDLVFVFRWNLSLGIPDWLFIVTEECIVRIISRIRWTPMMVLSTKLCPLGIEGTFFALLMCIDSVGQLTSKWGGGIFLHMFGVTRTDFSQLWLVILIRNVLRLVTLGLLFLVPNVGQGEDAISSHHFRKNDDSIGLQEGLELLPAHHSI